MTIKVFAGTINSVGSVQSNPTGKNVLVALCFVTLTMVKINGLPVGRATTVMSIVNGKTVMTDTWEGVNVTAKINTRTALTDNTITTDKVTKKTDASGKVTFGVFQGYQVTISSASLGADVVLDTTGLSTIDISTLI